MSDEEIELICYGDVDWEYDSVNGSMFSVPCSVTIPAPEPEDCVAIFRTVDDVRWLSVYERDGDPRDVETDLWTEETTDGRSCHEFWLDADAVAKADVIHVDTDGDELDEFLPDVEYRGLVARQRKRIRDFKQKRRAQRTVWEHARS